MLLFPTLTPRNSEWLTWYLLPFILRPALSVRTRLRQNNWPKARQGASWLGKDYPVAPRRETDQGQNWLHEKLLMNKQRAAQATPVPTPQSDMGTVTQKRMGRFITGIIATLRRKHRLRRSVTASMDASTALVTQTVAVSSCPCRSTSSLTRNVKRTLFHFDICHQSIAIWWKKMQQGKFENDSLCRKGCC